MARLSLEAISKRFGEGKPAVADFSLDVEAGTFLALLGPSGCGKTTILRMLAGFETPTSGTIRRGADILAEPGRFLPPEKRNMAMVFQSYALWPHMTVADNIGYPLKVRGVHGAAYRERVGAALDTVHMQGFGERRPAELSGGQRQRVALARCLVTEPDVILLDEPLANLDRHLRASMEETFREFHARTGATMVYVTHDQSEAMALADRVAVMAGGRLVQVDAPEAIYRRPETRQVAGLIGHGAVLLLPVEPGSSREMEAEAIESALAAACTGKPETAVLVRPEDVIPTNDGGIRATVESCVYKGERYALQLVDAGGRRLEAYCDRAAAPGEAIGVTIRRGWRLAEG